MTQRKPLRVMLILSTLENELIFLMTTVYCKLQHKFSFPQISTTNLAATLKRKKSYSLY